MKKNSGFSLLEVLVAFAVLAISLGVVMRVFSGSVRGALISEQYSRAMIVAESRLAAAIGKEELDEGSDSGETEDGFRWDVEIEPYVLEEGVEDLRVRVKPYQVTATVSWSDGKAERDFSLTTLRLGADQP